MAEINIEKKSGPPAWIWIVGVVVLALIAWAVISMMGGDDRDDWTTAQDTAVTTAPAQMPATAAAGTTPEAVQTFRRECAVDEGQRTDDMGQDHEFTVNCLQQLAAAIESTARHAAGQANVDAHVQTIRQHAQQIRDSDPMSTQHANWTRDAFDAGVNALESLQQASATPDTQAQGAVAQARQAAQQMRASELHTEQYTHVRSYFRNAAQALEGMARQHS